MAAKVIIKFAEIKSFINDFCDSNNKILKVFSIDLLEK
jgi:hypothetical protein